MVNNSYKVYNYNGTVIDGDMSTIAEETIQAINALKGVELSFSGPESVTDVPADTELLA